MATLVLIAFTSTTFALQCKALKKVSTRSLKLSHAVALAIGSGVLGAATLGASSFLQTTPSPTPTPHPEIEIATLPDGFREPHIRNTIFSRLVHVTKEIDTNQEGKFVFRTYFPNTTVNKFLAPAFDYENYPKYFPCVTKGEELAANTDRSELEYQLEIKVSVKILGKDVHIKPIHPHGRHRIVREGNETILHNEILNTESDFEFITQKMRIIPYGNGVLVEDTVHAKTKKSSMMAGLVKKLLIKQLSAIAEGYRAHLEAE